MLPSKFRQVFNVVNRLGQQSLAHLLKEWIYIQLCLPDPLLSAIVKWARPFCMFLSNVIILFGKISSNNMLLTFHNVLNEYLLFILTQIIFLIFQVFPPILPFVLLLLLYACIHTLPLLPYFLNIHFSARAVHDSHQSFLMSTKVNFI